MKKINGYFTAQAGSVLKKSERIICRVEEGRVYVCNGYFLLRMLPAEYAEAVQPATMCDPGNWIIEQKNGSERRELLPDEFPLVKMFNDAAAPVLNHDGPTIADAFPAEFPIGKGQVLRGFYNVAAGIAAFYNKAYLAAFDPSAALHAVSSKSAAVMMAGEEQIGVVMPCRASEAARRACVAWFTESAPEAAELEALRAELEAARNASRAAELERAEMLNKITEQAAALSAAEQRYKELQHTAFEIECERNDLRRELDAPKTEQAAAEQPAPDMKTAAEVIAARFAALDGVTATIKGAATSAPVVWLDGVTEKTADAVQAAGAKWSSKRAAYYVRVA